MTPVPVLLPASGQGLGVQNMVREIYGAAMNYARPALCERNTDMDPHNTGRGLVESPRRHDGRLWFAHWTAGDIRVLTEGGGSRARVRR
jgi:hypothetical protein